MLKIKTATALVYDHSMNAPEVSSQLKGVHAEEYIKLTSRFGVPVMQNSQLSSKLQALRETEQIPENLYTEVAQVFINLGKINSPQK